MPSARFIEAVLAPNTAECPIELVTLTHASFPAPLRFCTGGGDVTSLTRLFKGRAMQIQLPGESADAGGRRGRLVIDDTPRDVIAALRLAATKPTCLLEVALKAYPDDIELSWPGLEVLQVSPAGQDVEIIVGLRDDSQETFPVQSYSPHRCPGLF